MTSVKKWDRRLEDLFESYERTSPLVHALVVTVLPLVAIFISVGRGRYGVMAVVIAYIAGWLHRHTEDPRAGNILDPEKHPRSYFHEERDDD